MKIAYAKTVVRLNTSGKNPSTNSSRCKYTCFLDISVNFSFVDSWFELAVVYKLLQIPALKNLIMIMIIIIR